MVEIVSKRSINSKTYDQGGSFKLVAGMAPLHFADNQNIDFTPQATTTPLDGWKVDQAEYTYSLGRKSGQDGWFGFGGLQGQNTVFFRLARMGYLHWPTKAFDNISAAPSYLRANLTNTVESFSTGEEDLPVGLKATWGNIWNTPNNGEVSIDVSANGERLKLDVILNQAGREWVAANRPPSTQINSTYFGMVFQLDLTDIPKIHRGGTDYSVNDDIDDLDNLPTELRDSLDNLLAFMPVDYAYAGSKGNEQKVKLTKRFWKDADGNNYLLVGAKVAEINNLPAGDIRFDPTFGAAQVADNDRDGQEANDTDWLGNGFDSDGNHVGSLNAVNDYDMGMSWDNVTIPSGATITSATVELFMKWINGTGSILTRMQGFDVDDVAVFNATTGRPSQIAQTTALVDRTYTNASDWVDETYLSCDDASAIIQEIVDRAGWASGNALGVVIKNNGSASGDRWMFQDYGRSSGDAAKITIVYTVGAADPVPPLRRRLMMRQAA